MTASRQTTPRSYVARLLIALTGLVVPTTVLAVLGWYVLAESQYRIERGRIGSDIYTALLLFDIEKSALRSWSYRRALDQPAPAAERTNHLDAMRDQINRITAQAERAAALDRQRGKVLPEHDDRLNMLDYLVDVVDQLDLETQDLRRLGTVEPTLLSKIDSGFDQLRGTSSAEMLRRALSAETDALILERQRANRSLAAARNLFLYAGGGGLIATMTMALVLARRLRQPLHDLDTGLQAYAEGDFSYRFGRFRDREFVRLGTQLNAMATEVELARKRDADNRAHLEKKVAARTAALRRTLDDLSASEAARQKLLADIGHELRTPVTAIRGEAQVALREKTDNVPLYRAALTRIVDVSRQMGRLIDDLLVLVRDPQALDGISACETDIATVLAPALDLARSIAQQRDVTLITPDPLPNIDIWADPDRMRQVVICLLDNALRYSHAGGTVRLDIRATAAGTVLVEIADHGIGITAQDVPYAFDRGWRSVAARAHRPDGLGLGLAIAQRLTIAQGGHLMLRPADQGHGVIATVEIPGAPKAQERNN